jgi:ribonuclease VapC
MSEAAYLLDSSAVLAFLFGEEGANRVAELLGSAVVSSVNLTEVVAKQYDKGVSKADIVANLADLDLTVIAFDDDLAIRAGELRPVTRHLGLSLGDRACLATAQAGGCTVVTADRNWSKLELDIAIEVLR